MISEIGAVDDNGLRFIVDSLVQRGDLQRAPLDSPFHATLSFSGWERYEQLARGAETSKRAFMAMAYGNAVLAAAFVEHFKPAALEAGFKLARLDENPQAGSIDARLRVEIRAARFLVADLSDGNPGAYWEAGFAEGLGKPVVYMCSRDVWKTQRTHFDTEHMHTIIWDATDFQRAAKTLRATIRATLPNEARMPSEDEIRREGSN
jgi:hypothetical protein